MSPSPSMSTPGTAKASGVPAFNRQHAPRPLGFHIAMATNTWLGAAAAAPAFLSGLPLAHEQLTAEAGELRQRLLGLLHPALGEAILGEAQLRIQAMLAGVAAYQAHPYRRDLATPPVAFSVGSLRLLDYAPASDAPVIFAVPSLVNPAYILDLAADASLMRYLAANGFRPLLVDWGAPHGAELGFTLADYITERLEPALAAAAGAGPVTLLGYCMGGNLTLALALRRPELVRAQMFLATPWNFHAESVTLTRATSAILSGALALLEPDAPVPIDMLQIFFASLDPCLNDRKFRRFGTLDQDSPAARRFVAIEDWANDGMALARPVAMECLYDWYGGNKPGLGTWTIDGQTIDPSAAEKPALVAVPHTDRIVPPLSATALADLLPDASVIRATAGHVAMIAGLRAETTLWRPLLAWCQAHAR